MKICNIVNEDRYYVDDSIELYIEIKEKLLSRKSFRIYSNKSINKIQIKISLSGKELYGDEEDVYKELYIYPHLSRGKKHYDNYVTFSNSLEYVYEYDCKDFIISEDVIPEHIKKTADKLMIETGKTNLDYSLNQKYKDSLDDRVGRKADINVDGVEVGVQEYQKFRYVETKDKVNRKIVKGYYTQFSSNEKINLDKIAKLYIEYNLLVNNLHDDFNYAIYSLNGIEYYRYRHKAYSEVNSNMIIMRNIRKITFEDYVKKTNELIHYDKGFRNVISDQYYLKCNLSNADVILKKYFYVRYFEHIIYFTRRKVEKTNFYTGLKEDTIIELDLLKTEFKEKGLNWNSNKQKYSNKQLIAILLILYKNYELCPSYFKQFSMITEFDLSIENILSLAIKLADDRNDLVHVNLETKINIALFEFIQELNYWLFLNILNSGYRTLEDLQSIAIDDGLFTRINISPNEYYLMNNEYSYNFNKNAVKKVY